MVPTVERGLREVVFCSMEMAGLRAVDGVDVGALHLVEELAGVGGEGFDVAALAFGVDGVEREGGFAGAGEAGDDGEGVAGDRDVDVAQVVLARAADGDVSDTHVSYQARFGQDSRIRHLACYEIQAGGGVLLRRDSDLGNPMAQSMYPKEQ